MHLPSDSTVWRVEKDTFCILKLGVDMKGQFDAQFFVASRIERTSIVKFTGFYLGNSFLAETSVVKDIVEVVDDAVLLLSMLSYCHDDDAVDNVDITAVTMTLLTTLIFDAADEEEDVDRNWLLTREGACDSCFGAGVLCFIVLQAGINCE